MNKKMEEALRSRIREEEGVEVDQEFLDHLRELASKNIEYMDWTPLRRKSLSEWFAEVKQVGLRELLRGDYGPQVVADALIVLAFEVGMKLGKEEQS